MATQNGDTASWATTAATATAAPPPTRRARDVCRSDKPQNNATIPIRYRSWSTTVGVWTTSDQRNRSVAPASRPSCRRRVVPEPVHASAEEQQHHPDDDRRTRPPYPATDRDRGRTDDRHDERRLQQLERAMHGRIGPKPSVADSEPALDPTDGTDHRHQRADHRNRNAQTRKARPRTGVAIQGRLLGERRPTMRPVSIARTHPGDEHTQRHGVDRQRDQRLVLLRRPVLLSARR